MVSSSNENNTVQKGRLERDGLKKQYTYHRVMRAACPESSSSPSQTRKVVPFPAGLCPACAGTAAGHSFRLRLYGLETFCFMIFIIQAVPGSVKLSAYGLSCYGVTLLSALYPPIRHKKAPAARDFRACWGLSYLFSSEGSPSASCSRKRAYASGVLRFARMTFRSHSFRSSSLK